MPNGVLYTWFKPAFTRRKWFPMQPEHTWVTSYDDLDESPPDRSKGDYWFCWGDSWTKAASTSVRDAAADLDAARLICKPNDPEAHAGIPGPYRANGTCHQVANRVLYATAYSGHEPQTVQGAHGYKATRFAWGPYGCLGNPAGLEDWERMKTRVHELWRNTGGGR